MRSDKLKIAVIGGGSSYTPELIEGFINRYNELPVGDIYLVDIEDGRAKLEIVGELAKRMVARAGVPINIHLTMDRQKAIEGADFVSTQIRVGLLDARARDERIPLQYNRIGQETTGAGGFAKALRTIPVILDICKDIEELSPHAYLLNFTNPAGIVTEAVLNHSNVRTIGLCNLPINMRIQLANMMNVDVSRVHTEMVGINHLNWTTRVYIDGEDVTNEVLFRVSTSQGLTMKNIPEFGWSSEFLSSLGSIPCSYLRYYYMSDEMLEHQVEAARTTGTRAEVVKRVETELFELYKDPNLMIKPPQLEQRGGAFYSLAAVNLISSIYNDAKDIQTVNVKNNGIIECLDDNACIEVNCVIDAQGAHPISLAAPIGPQIKGLLQVVKAYEQLTVKAAVYGDRNAAIQALAIHPLVHSGTVARSLADDILSANRGYLPQFA